MNGGLKDLTPDQLRRQLVLGGILLPFAGMVPVQAQNTSQTNTPNTLWRPPAQVNFDYDMQGHWNGPISGSGNVVWTYDAASTQYTLDLTISALFLSFLYASRGTYQTESGFTPTSYREQRIGRDRTVTFDHDAQKIFFSWKPRSESLQLPPGIQDTTSVMMQIAYLLANNPQDARAGTQYAFPIGRMGSIKHWEFSVLDTPQVETRVDRYETLHISRLAPASGQDTDLRVEFWLAPQLHYLPVQMAFNMKNNTYLRVNLRRIRQLIA